MIVFPRCMLVGLAIALAVAGCSSSGGQPGATSAARTGSPTDTTASSPATPTASGTPADAATTRAVARAYETFFGATSTAAQSQAALQHGSQFAKTLAEQGNSSYADKSSAKVTSVRVAGNLAYIRFSILSNGSALLSGTQGYAVREGGVWKVAAQTFCNLLTLQGDAPAQCHDATITALPH